MTIATWHSPYIKKVLCYITCPRCSAKPGVECRGTNSTHAARLQAASKKGIKVP